MSSNCPMQRNFKVLSLINNFLRFDLNFECWVIGIYLIRRKICFSFTFWIFVRIISINRQSAFITQNVIYSYSSFKGADLLVTSKKSNYLGFFFFLLHIKIVNNKCFSTWKICISRRYYKIFITKYWEIRGI